MKRKMAGIIGFFGLVLDVLAANNKMNDISILLDTGKMPQPTFDKTSGEIGLWCLLIGVPCLILGVWGIWGWRKKKSK